MVIRPDGMIGLCLSMARLVSSSLGRVLGWLAIAAAALGMLLPLAYEIRSLLSIGYVEHYVVRSAWNVLFGILVFGAFVWLHFEWTSSALKSAICALGAIGAVFAPIAGVLVWSMAPRFWIVWPTYGQDFLYGVCLWAVAKSHPRSKALAVAVTATTCGLFVLMPDSVSENTIGIGATVSFCVFLWLIGLFLSIRKRLASVLRVPLPACVWYYGIVVRGDVSSPDIVWLCLSAILISELRAFVAPLASSEEA